MDTTNLLRSHCISMSMECFDNARMFRVRCDIANRATMLELRQAVTRALDGGLRTVVISFTADSYLFSEIIPHLIKLNDLVESRGAQMRLFEHDPELRAILERIGITRIVRVVGALSELPLGSHIP